MGHKFKHVPQVATALRAQGIGCSRREKDGRPLPPHRLCAVLARLPSFGVRVPPDLIVVSIVSVPAFGRLFPCGPIAVEAKGKAPAPSIFKNIVVFDVPIEKEFGLILVSGDRADVLSRRDVPHDSE